MLLAAPQADHLVGFSGADLKFICERAVQLAVRESIQAEQDAELEGAGGGGTHGPQVNPRAGLSTNKMALIISDCGAMRYPTIKWP